MIDLELKVNSYLEAYRIAKDKKIYVCCQVGLRGYIACTILNQYGYNTSNIDGGYKTYSSIKNSEKLVKSQDESVKVTL